MKSNMPMKWITVLGAFAMLIFSAAPAHAADKDDLRQRAEKRYPELLKLKTAGIIGETSSGFLEVVEGKDASAEARKLVSEENSDRQALYSILAKEQNATEEQVARQAARRNFDRAAPGEFLKEGGKWRQKGR